MDRITVSIREDQHAELERLVEDGSYDSKSEAVRGLLARAQQLHQLEDRVEELERERRVLLEQLAERRSTPVRPPGETFTARVRWLLFGGSGNG